MAKMRIIKIKKLKSGKLPRRVYMLEKPNTVALMHKDSGKLFGRIKVRGKAKPDNTSVRRIRAGVDMDGDGISDGGQIYGRTKAVRSSKRAKGYIRKL